MDATGSLGLTDHPDAPPIGVNIIGNVDSPAINFHTDAIRAFMGQRLAAAVFQDVLGGGRQSGGLEDLTRGDEPAAEQSQTESPKPGEALLNVLFNALSKKKQQEEDPPN